MSSFWNSDNWEISSAGRGRVVCLPSSLDGDLGIYVGFGAYGGKINASALLDLSRFQSYCYWLYVAVSDFRSRGIEEIMKVSDPYEEETIEEYTTRCKSEILGLCQKQWEAIPHEKLLETLDMESSFWSGDTWKETASNKFQAYPNSFSFQASYDQRRRREGEEIKGLFIKDSLQVAVWATPEGSRSKESMAKTLRTAFAPVRDSLEKIQKTIREG